MYHRVVVLREVTQTIGHKVSTNKGNKKMKMKVMEKPQYPEIDIVAKTVESECGTIDRKSIGRCLLTTEAVDKGYMVVGGDDSLVKTVKEAEEIEVKVEFVGGVKSLASFKFFKHYTAENKENPNVVDIYTEESDKLERIRECAARMAEAHPECDGQWKIVDKDGKRVFIRVICKYLKANGKIEA